MNIRTIVCCLGFLLGNLNVTGQSAESNMPVPGITEPIMDVTLSAVVPGTIGEHHFEEGDWVKNGEIIVSFKKRLEELAVQRRQLVKDTVAKELAASRKIHETTESVSTEELAKKQLEYEVAEVDLETAREELKQMEVLAPFEGVITDIYLEVGEACRAQEPVVRLVDTRQCQFVCNMEARRAYHLEPGQKYPLQIPAGSETVTVEGTVVYVSPVVDPASGLRKVKLLFDNRAGTIQPGVTGVLLMKEGSYGA